MALLLWYAEVATKRRQEVGVFLVVARIIEWSTPANGWKTIDFTEVVDLTYWVRNKIIGWSEEERSRWEGEGGFVPPDDFWHWP